MKQTSLWGMIYSRPASGMVFYKAPPGRAVRNHYTTRPAFREYFRQWF